MSPCCRHFSTPYTLESTYRCATSQNDRYNVSPREFSIVSYARSWFISWVDRSIYVQRDVRGVCPGSRSWTVNVRVAENGRAIRLDGAISPRSGSATRSYPPSTRRIFSGNDEERRMINASLQNCLLLTLERWIGLRSSPEGGREKK